jgi:transposase
MGKSIREIVRETGIARNKVRKYLRSDGIPESQPRRKRGSKLDPFKPLLDDYMAQGITNCEVLGERIQLQGYTGGKTLVKDYVKPFRPPRQIPAVQRYETKPGEQAQVDWGICEYIDEQGVLHKVPVFVMVLGYSRAIYVEFAKRCDIRSFLRCLIHVLEYFGGVPNVMLTDRMKTVILGMGDDRKPRWHPLFADFAAAIGMVPRVCRARRPQTKGKVERGVRFVNDNFLPGRTFTDLGDLNAQARRWCDEKNRRVHGTTGERPCDRLPSRTCPLKRNSLRFASRRGASVRMALSASTGCAMAYRGPTAVGKSPYACCGAALRCGSTVGWSPIIPRCTVRVLSPCCLVSTPAFRLPKATPPLGRALDLYDRLAEVSA